MRWQVWSAIFVSVRQHLKLPAVKLSDRPTHNNLYHPLHPLCTSQAKIPPKFSTCPRGTRANSPCHISDWHMTAISLTSRSAGPPHHCAVVTSHNLMTPSAQVNPCPQITLGGVLFIYWWGQEKTGGGWGMPQKVGKFPYHAHGDDSSPSMSFHKLCPGAAWAFISCVLELDVWM